MYGCYFYLKPYNFEKDTEKKYPIRNIKTHLAVDQRHKVLHIETKSEVDLVIKHVQNGKRFCIPVPKSYTISLIYSSEKNASPIQKTTRLWQKLSIRLHLKYAQTN